MFTDSLSAPINYPGYRPTSELRGNSLVELRIKASSEVT
jgi:hypothetical protein